MSVQLFPPLPWGALVCTWALRSSVWIQISSKFHCPCLEAKGVICDPVSLWILLLFLISIWCVFVRMRPLWSMLQHLRSRSGFFFHHVGASYWTKLSNLAANAESSCQCSCFFGFCCFQSPVAMLTLNSLCCWVRLALILWSSCLYLPWVGIVGVHQHTVPETT